MQYTTHYNLNLPEGTDIVNPLVQDNPNYSAIDTALYNNKLRVVGDATEVKSGTVHAITRSDSDIDVMRFTATGDWITGDTMTVDGNPVSVYLSDGTAPLTGAYVINTEVLAAINGSRVTLYTGAGAVTSIDADDVIYDNSVSGLPATSAQAAIDEVFEDVTILGNTKLNASKILFVTANVSVTGAIGEVNVPYGKTFINVPYIFVTLAPGSYSFAGNAICAYAKAAGTSACDIRVTTSNAGATMTVPVILMIVDNDQ